MRIREIFGSLLLCVLLQACVAVDPGQTQDEKASAVNVQLGIGYLQQSKLDLASDKLTKAVRQDPNSAVAHNAYAILQERLEQYDLAEFHYEKATKLDPKIRRRRTITALSCVDVGANSNRKNISCARSKIRSTVHRNTPIPMPRCA